MHRWLGIRPAGAMPTVGEIAAHWAGWSVLFEVIGPHIMRTTGDPLDVVAYAGGALVAAGYWRWQAGRPADFDFLAGHYRWMEWVLAGRKLQRCREAFLSSIPPPRRALLVGEGNGRFLTKLRSAYPQVRCICVDASAGMLERARASLEAAGLGVEGIQFVHADILEWTPPAQEFDLVATHFVLDCFRPEQLEGLVGRLAEAAAPKARWLLSDFCEPQSGLCKWRARLILKTMYVFFGLTTGLPADRLTSPDPSLVRQGFVLRQRHLFEWGLLHTDLWETD